MRVEFIEVLIRISRYLMAGIILNQSLKYVFDNVICNFGAAIPVQMPPTSWWQLVASGQA